MSNRNGDQPAFPQAIGHDTNGEIIGSYALPHGGGFTKREQAALTILASWAYDMTDRGAPQHFEYTVAASFKLADEFLKQAEPNGDSNEPA